MTARIPARARLLAVPLVAAATAVLPTAAARAVPSPEVGAPVLAIAGGFAPADIWIPHGTSVLFVNADPTGEFHDITSIDGDGSGGHMFASKTVAFGGTAIADVSSLPPSTYPYTCSVHSYMLGTINIV
jgi:plastocyanin